MKIKIFATRPAPIEVDLVLLLIRLVCGYAFILIGWGKIQNPTSWAGESSVYPAFFLVLAAISEFCGGIALMLGLVTRLAAFGIACTMAVAIHAHITMMGDPFVNLTGGGSYQLPAVYGLVALLMFAGGPGRFSLDRLLFGIHNGLRVKSNHDTAAYGGSI